MAQYILPLLHFSPLLILNPISNNYPTFHIIKNSQNSGLFLLFFRTEINFGLPKTDNLIVFSDFQCSFPEKKSST